MVATKTEDLAIKNNFVFKRKNRAMYLKYWLLIFLPPILFKANNTLHVLYNIKSFAFLTFQYNSKLYPWSL